MNSAPNLSDWMLFVTPLFQASRPSFDLVLAMCAHHFRHSYTLKIHSHILSKFIMFYNIAITEDNTIM